MANNDTQINPAAHAAPMAIPCALQLRPHAAGRSSLEGPWKKSAPAPRASASASVVPDSIELTESEIVDAELHEVRAKDEDDEDMRANQ